MPKPAGHPSLFRGVWGVMDDSHVPSEQSGRRSSGGRDGREAGGVMSGCQPTGANSGLLGARGASPHRRRLSLGRAQPPGGGCSGRLRVPGCVCLHLSPLQQGQGGLLVPPSPNPSHARCSKRCLDEFSV